MPFAGLVEMIPKSTPLVLINRENPGIDRKNFLFLGGDMDKNVKEIINKCGWDSDLEALKKKMN